VEQYIKDAWRQGEVVLALFLNIQATFPNMCKDCLLKVMENCNIAEGYRKYIDMILMQQQIQLKYNNQISSPFSPPNGCCQGCPLLMLLYIIYNAPLVCIADGSNPRAWLVDHH
jgi:hypothetical protein